MLPCALRILPGTKLQPWYGLFWLYLAWLSLIPLSKLQKATLGTSLPSNAPARPPNLCGRESQRWFAFLGVLIPLSKKVFNGFRKRR